MSWLRATASPIPFVLVSRIDGQGLTGATVTATVVKDYGSQAVVEGTIIERGGGQYLLNASATDMDGDVLGFLMTATNAVPIEITIRTATGTEGTAIYTYGTGVTIGQTLAEQLLNVQAAITAVLTGGQTVSLDGATYTKADIGALFRIQERLENKIDRGDRGRVSRCEF